VRLARDGWLHVVAGIVACLILPAYSRAAGTGALAWVMFSRSDSFRLSVRAFDRDGVEHLLHPIELGQGMDSALRMYLRIADRFATWPVGQTFESRLSELAQNGCRAGSYARVEVTLERRSALDAPVHTVHERALCPQ
jgi:hypothetical protein